MLNKDEQLRMLNNNNIKELNKEEMKETSGGSITVAAAVGAGFIAGYFLGRR